MDKVVKKIAKIIKSKPKDSIRMTGGNVFSNHFTISITICDDAFPHVTAQTVMTFKVGCMHVHPACYVHGFVSLVLDRIQRGITTNAFQVGK